MGRVFVHTQLALNWYSNLIHPLTLTLTLTPTPTPTSSSKSNLHVQYKTDT